jgi:PAS domain S-box-containing protein
MIDRSNTVTKRIGSYIALSLVLLVVHFLIRDSSWQGGKQLHTIMEVAATLLALIVGTTSLVWYYSKNNYTFLLVGMGFLGTSFLDGYHATVTSMFFERLWPSWSPSLIAWSWNASRTVLGLLMFLSWWVWYREERLGPKAINSDITTYIVMLLLTLSSILFFVFVPLLRPYYPEFVLGRPQELVAGLFFLVALIGYLHKGYWKWDSYEHWIVLFLIIGFAGQALFMSFSMRLFDGMFDVAHLLKGVSYVCIMVGLSIKMSYSIREAGESAERLRIIAEAAPNAIVMANEEGNITLVNSQAERLFLYAPGEMVGQSVEILLPEMGRQQHFGYRKKYFGEPNIRLMAAPRDLAGVRKDGTELPIEVRLAPVNMNQKRFVLASIMDVTERRRAEQLLRIQAKDLARSNQELDQFAYAVSHDLKSPLRGIGSLAAWLGEDYKDKLGAKGREKIELLMNRVKRMSDLIDGILQYSRVARTTDEKKKVDLSLLVKENIDLLSPPDHINIKILDDLPTITCERSRVEQIFVNLISNAVKHMDKPKGEVVIRCIQDNGYWKFAVQDNGPGIEKRHFKRIFRMFQTLISRDDAKSAGIGLSLVEKAVELSGGKVWVESRLGEGSTFFFTLPNS